MEFGILGPLEVRNERGAVAVGGTKRRAVLAVLLLHANEPVSAERLALALWGEDAPATAVQTVRVHVSRLRKALGEEGIVATAPAGYCLRVLPGELDADRVAGLVEEGRGALADGRLEHAAAVLREASSLWRGPPLADLSGEPFAVAEIRRLEELRSAMTELAIDLDLARGRHREVIGELEAALAKHPLREHLHAQRMLALYRSGRQADALKAYREARRTLVQEIGVEPGAELRQLHEAILRQDASLELPVQSALPPELDVTTPLAGRERELAWLRERWRGAREGTGAVVLVTGPAGIGKTRLAAELAAEAHRDGATVIYGAAPLDAERPTLAIVEEPADLPPRPTGPTLILATAREGRPDGADAALALEPLERVAIASIARSYGALRVDDVIGAGDGLPAEVHRRAAVQAQAAAQERLRAVAGQAASERTSLRVAEAELADDVVELAFARERAEALGPPPDVVACPFKGLASFDVADADFFFGRERLVAEMVARLAGSPLLGIVGPSGSGKSSALRAGLLSALARGTLPGSQDWPLALLRPGEHPMAALEQATGGVDPRKRVVIAVDQFEETFTLCRDPAERTAFVDALVQAARDPQRGAATIVALRADFYGRCAAYPELSRLLGANHLLVGPMRRDELRRAIELPARRVGLRVEPELVDRMLADVEGEPGALPLLSTALLELWQQRDIRRLTLSAYEGTGGVRKAVARLAEAAYARLDPEQQRVSRGILLRLAGDGMGDAVVRRRVPLLELSPSTSPVLDVLANARLITVSEGSIEVAHEALLREWPRLRGWLEDDAQGRHLHRHLIDAVRDWDSGGRDPGDLYRGPRLASALEWRAEHEQDVSPTERAFLDASDAYRQHEQAARRRRLRLAFAGLTTALVTITVVAIMAVYQGRQTEHQRDIAASRALAANAINTLQADPGLSLALARRAVATASTTQATTALRQAVLGYRAVAVIPASRQPVYGVDLSRDGRRAVSASRDGRLRVWDLADDKAILTVQAYPHHAFSPRFSPDERWVASAGYDGTVALTNVKTRQRRVLIPSTGAPAPAVDYAHDGAHVASGDVAGVVRVAATTPNGRIQVLRGHRAEVNQVAFSDDARWLASASSDGTVRLWDLHDRGKSTVLPGGRNGMWSVSFRRGGHELLSGDGDGWLHFWRVPGGRLEKKVRATDQLIFAARFDPDGRRIVTAGQDGEVRLVDAVGGGVAAILRGHSGEIFDVRFTPNGDRVISAGRDGTVRIWDPGARRVIRGPVSRVRFSADGDRFVAGSTGGAIRLYRTRTGGLDGVLRGHSKLSFPRFSPDGRSVISASEDGTVRTWSASGGPSRHVYRDNGQEVYAASFDRHARRFVSGGWDGRVVVRDLTGKPALHAGHTPRSVYDVAFSPSDRHLVSAGDDGTIRIWDAQRTDRPLRVLLGHRGRVNSVAFSRDGRRIVSAGDDGTVRVWSLSGGGHDAVLRGHDGAVQSAAFNDAGDRIVSAGLDGTVRVWDSRGGASLVTLEHYQRDASSASFGPHGSSVLSSGDQNEIRLSSCEVCGSLDSVLRLARTRKAHEFSAEERRRFLAEG